MPPGIYDITNKTYIRPADRIEELLGSEEQAFGKFAKDYSGITWAVNHKLRNTNLLIGLWKTDSLNPASFWQIQQIDYENLIINWTAPVDGRIVIYSVRPFTGVAIVHNQTTPSLKWTILHNFGTTDVIYTCWTGGTIITPVSAVTLDNNTVELTFTFPVIGTCVMVIADPEQSPSVHIDWKNIYNLPTGFPPSPHTHDATEITGDGLDITTFGGYAAEEYVRHKQVGTKVAPLQPKGGTTDPVEYEVPPAYMPTPLPFIVGDSDGYMTAVKMTFLSSKKHPLFVIKNPTTKEAVIDMQPVIRQVDISGNLIANAGVSDNAWKASTDYLTKLEIGPGLIAYLSNANTLKLSLAAGAAATFTRPVFNAGDEWGITDSVFNIPGGYTLGIYESINGSGSSSVSLDNIPLMSPANSNLNITFDVKSQTEESQFLELTDDRVTQDQMDFTDDHFIFEDEVMIDAGGSPVTIPTGIDAIYFDPTDNTYVLRIPSTPAGFSWSYHKLNPLTKTSFVWGVAPSASTYEHTAMCGGVIYALNPLSPSGFELLSAVANTIPLWSWTTEGTFLTETMPVITSGGRIRFRVLDDYLVILNTTVNTLAVYQISLGVKISEKILPRVAVDFDLWPDGYASIIFKDEDSLWVTNQPVWTADYTFRPSIDNRMAGCTSFAIRPNDLGGLGLVEPNLVRYSMISKQNPTDFYRTGEVTLWLRAPYCLQVSPLWSQLLNITWEDYDISAYDDVRIGFYPGDAPTLPDTLYTWTGSAFVAFPASDLPTVGQPLTAINTIQLMTNEKLSYAIYIKKGKKRALEKGYIVHNFTATYTNTGYMHPVPFGGPSTSSDHLEIQCGVGAIRIKNTLGRNLQGVKLVATPAV